MKVVRGGHLKQNVINSATMSGSRRRPDDGVVETIAGRKHRPDDACLPTKCLPQGVALG
jgi:hypothetical protein